MAGCLQDATMRLGWRRPALPPHQGGIALPFDVATSSTVIHHTDASRISIEAMARGRLIVPYRPSCRSIIRIHGQGWTEP